MARPHHEAAANEDAELDQTGSPPEKTSDPVRVYLRGDGAWLPLFNSRAGIDFASGWNGKPARAEDRSRSPSC